MKVALINNNPAVSRLATLSLNKLGYEYIEINNLEELEGRHFDILILDSDINVGNINLSQIASKILYLSSKSSPLFQGADKILPKPFLPTEFISILESIATIKNNEANKDELNDEMISIDETPFMDEFSDEMFKMDGELEDIKFDDIKFDDEIKELDSSDIDENLNEIQNLELPEPMQDFSDFDEPEPEKILSDEIKFDDLNEQFSDEPEVLLDEVKFDDESLNEPMSDIQADFTDGLAIDEIEITDNMQDEISQDFMVDEIKFIEPTDEPKSEIVDDIAENVAENIDEIKFDIENDEPKFELSDEINIDNEDSKDNFKAFEIVDVADEISDKIDDKFNDEIGDFGVDLADEVAIKIDDENVDFSGEMSDEISKISDEIVGEISEFDAQDEIMKDEFDLADDESDTFADIRHTIEEIDSLDNELNLADIKIDEPSQNIENLAQDDFGFDDEIDSEILVQSSDENAANLAYESDEKSQDDSVYDLATSGLNLNIDEISDATSIDEISQKQMAMALDESIDFDDEVEPVADLSDVSSEVSNDVKTQIESKLTEQVSAIFNVNSIKEALKGMNIKINITFEEK